MVVMAGSYRFDCAEIVLRIMNNSGVIIYDNSDEYPKGANYSYLSEHLMLTNQVS